MKLYLLEMALDAEWNFYLEEAIKHLKEDNDALRMYCEGHLHMIQKIRIMAGLKGDERDIDLIIAESLK
jgi:hypothetical protein